MKKGLRILTLSMCLFGWHSASNAGIPVIDATNLTQSILQVTHALTQIKELQSQLTQAKKQLDSMSGSRGLGSAINSSYDPNVAVVVSGVLTANGLNSGSINGLIGATSALYDEANNNSALFQGQTKLTRQQAQTRFTELTGLIAKVDSSPDQKDVLDLQARVGAESVMLQNELVKLHAMNYEAQANKELLAQKKTQAMLEDLGTW